MNIRLLCTWISFTVTSSLFIMGLWHLLFVNSLSSSSKNQYLPAPLNAKNEKSLASSSGPKQPFTGNILLLGGDLVNQNTDAIWLMHLSPNIDMHFLFIPRDTQISSSVKSYKLNASYPKGGAFKTLLDLNKTLNIEANYYLFIRLDFFRKLIDTLGGVEFFVPEDLKYQDPVQNLTIDLHAGHQRLNGEQAEALLRFRQFQDGHISDHFDGSDLLRIKNQQNFLRAFLAQKLNVRYIPQFQKILDTLFDDLDTNIPMEMILAGLNALTMQKSPNIYMHTLPGEPAYIHDTWYYIPDKDKSYRLLADFFTP